jgi:hypothetical protein
MSARINRSFDFQAGVRFDDDFYMNQYEVVVDFIVDSESIREQNIALERIKYFLSECIENSIFIQDTETEAIEKYVEANLKVCVLPEEPYDQIIGIMLMVKINAITEGRLSITDLSICSKMSDGVSCLQSFEENTGPFKLPGWWNDNNTKISNLLSNSKSKKILKLVKPPIDWEDVFLGWKEKSNLVKNTPSAEIVFGIFDNKNK